eukprot:39296_1
MNWFINVGQCDHVLMISPDSVGSFLLDLDGAMVRVFGMWERPEHALTNFEQRISVADNLMAPERGWNGLTLVADNLMTRRSVFCFEYISVTDHLMAPELGWNAITLVRCEHNATPERVLCRVHPHAFRTSDIIVGSVCVSLDVSLLLECSVIG